MLKQQLVDGKLLDEFDKRMAVVETAYADLTHATSDYWWNLYKIHQDDLWRARYDSHGDWLGTLLTERFGPRRQTFYTVMRAIERWKSFGMAYPKIYSLLGDRKVALEGDLEELFDKDGLKPEVAEQLEEQGITPLELIEQATGRRHVSALRITAGGHGVGRAVVDHPDLGHRQAGADGEVLDRTI